MAEIICYLEGCLLPALKTADCFAYCSREHKAQVVMVDYEVGKQKPRNVKEMQLGVKKWKEESKQRDLADKGRLF